MLTGTPVRVRLLAMMLIVSAGYDAHALDPLAGMRMSVNGYAWCIRQMKQLADAKLGGGIALVTEGGYHLQALGRCLQATLTVLDEGGVAGEYEFGSATHRAADAIDQVRAARPPADPLQLS